MASGSDRLSVPEDDDVTVSPQDISRRVTAGDCIILVVSTDPKSVPVNNA